jgi:HTH-type transcriptional regulator/antitoxin HigA
MKTEITEQLYTSALARMEELLPLVNDETPADDRYAIELSLMSDIVMEYETLNFPIAIPSLAEVMKLKLEEQKITRKTLSVRLGVSPSRISEYLSGKSEPTLKIARAISRELNIPPAIVLGV